MVLVIQDNLSLLYFTYNCLGSYYTSGSCVYSHIISSSFWLKDEFVLEIEFSKFETTFSEDNKEGCIFL